ncbi:hypothetical protein QUB36_01710 [Microcoleus sp. AT8-B1]|uniref:hypothetical protein n=1 Tax=unclassified Microcoleus TaxID=2642155 RepID=UPI002FD71BDA
MPASRTVRAVPVVQLSPLQPCQPSNHPKTPHTALNAAFFTRASASRPIASHLVTVDRLGVIRSPC